MIIEKKNFLASFMPSPFLTPLKQSHWWPWAKKGDVNKRQKSLGNVVEKRKKLRKKNITVGIKRNCSKETTLRGRTEGTHRTTHKANSGLNNIKKHLTTPTHNPHQTTTTSSITTALTYSKKISLLQIQIANLSLKIFDKSYHGSRGMQEEWIT